MLGAQAAANFVYLVSQLLGCCESCKAQLWHGQFAISVKGIKWHNLFYLRDLQPNKWKTRYVIIYRTSLNRLSKKNDEFFYVKDSVSHRWVTFYH